MGLQVFRAHVHFHVAAQEVDAPGLGEVGRERPAPEAVEVMGLGRHPEPLFEDDRRATHRGTNGSTPPQ